MNTYANLKSHSKAEFSAMSPGLRDRRLDFFVEKFKQGKLNYDLRRWSAEQIECALDAKLGAGEAIAPWIKKCGYSDLIGARSRFWKDSTMYASWLRKGAIGWEVARQGEPDWANPHVQSETIPAAPIRISRRL